MRHSALWEGQGQLSPLARSEWLRSGYTFGFLAPAANSPAATTSLKSMKKESPRRCGSAGAEWRRGESNPRPDEQLPELLHAYSLIMLLQPHPPSDRLALARFLVLSRWRPLGRGLLASLMVYPVGALIRRRRGTGADLSRESQVFCGVCFFDRLLTRPTHQPRHATQTSSQQSKPLRPLNGSRRDPGVSTR